MNKSVKKIEQFIEKHYELFFRLLAIIIIFGISIYIKTEPTDELWNFQNIYKIYNGYKIYVDANVITTPLFHFIGLIIFKIFEANFFVFKMYGILVNIFLFFGVYKIFRSLNISNNAARLLSLVSVLASINVYHNTANYNNMCLVFAIYGISIIINKQNYSNTKVIILESLTAFLILITKQNIGILYLCSLCIYNLTFEKENKVKNILKIAFINFVLIGIFLIILFKLGILEGFISYSILGIKEFAIKNIAIEKPAIKLIVIALITSILVILINFKKILKEEEIKKVNIISCFSFPFLIITYPIVNVAHIDVGLFLTYILFIYIIYIALIEKLFEEKFIDKIKNFLILLLIIVSFIQICIYLNKIDYNYKYNKIYFGAILEEKIKDKIIVVTDYINNSKEKVVIISTDAGLYMLPLNINNGSFDEPLLGNFGKEGEEGIIKKIENMKNTKILISKEKKVYQESDKIIKYIKENMIYLGEIEDLLIYKTKQ